jgi:hypothetical protein
MRRASKEGLEGLGVAAMVLLMQLLVFIRLLVLDLLGRTLRSQLWRLPMLQLLGGQLCGASSRRCSRTTRSPDIRCKWSVYQSKTIMQRNTCDSAAAHRAWALIWVGDR